MFVSKDRVMTRIVIERGSFWRIRRFATSTADTKWPTPGAGMKTSSAFFVSAICFFSWSYRSVLSPIHKKFMCFRTLYPAHCIIFNGFSLERGECEVMAYIMFCLLYNVKVALFQIIIIKKVAFCQDCVWFFWKAWFLFAF